MRGPSYQDMIANMQKGLRYIQKFGQDARPRVAWLDPFGHFQHGTLNAMFSFDMFIVGRIDFQEKAARFATKTMEMVWRPRSAARTSRWYNSTRSNSVLATPGFNFEEISALGSLQQISTTAQDFAAFMQEVGRICNKLITCAVWKRFSVYACI